jgi:hypothetical protein
MVRRTSDVRPPVTGATNVWDRLRAHPFLATVVATYYITFLAIGAADGSSQTPVYAAVVMALVALIAVLDGRRPFPDYVLWGLALWGAMHMAGGLVPMPEERALYNTWLLPFLRYDQLTHAIGFGFAGLAVWAYLRHDLSPGRAGAALAWFGGVAIGGLNEMIEFLLTRVSSETNVGGFENTGWDLVANFIGATLAAWWVRWRARPSRLGP